MEVIETIYHLADKQCWIDQSEQGAYAGRPEDLDDGFLHFSTAKQIVESARVHKAGIENLVLLAVDVEMLGSSLKWEKSRKGALFPHIYEPVPMNAVIWAHPLVLDEEGLHIFPEHLFDAYED